MDSTLTADDLIRVALGLHDGRVILSRITADGTEESFVVTVAKLDPDDMPKPTHSSTTL